MPGIGCKGVKRTEKQRGDGGGGFGQRGRRGRCCQLRSGGCCCPWVPPRPPFATLSWGSCCPQRPSVTPRGSCHCQATTRREKKQVFAFSNLLILMPMPRMTEPKRNPCGPWSGRRGLQGFSRSSSQASLGGQCGAGSPRLPPSAQKPPHPLTPPSQSFSRQGYNLKN